MTIPHQITPSHKHNLEQRCGRVWISWALIGPEILEILLCHLLSTHLTNSCLTMGQCFKIENLAGNIYSLLQMERCLLTIHLPP